MKKIDFNRNWTCRCLTRDEEPYSVTLPHDAMRSEPRTGESVSEGNSGWYLGGDYEYTKHVFVPSEYSGKKVLIEFESVYHNAEVYINGKKAAYRPYGYTNFYVDTEGFLKYEAQNEIRVIARNSDQPNSRWYSGTGIYRPVYLWTGDQKYIPVNGIKIHTVSYAPAVIEVEIKTSCLGRVKAEVLDKENCILTQEVENTGHPSVFRMEIPNAKLWDCDHPNLYTLRATFGEDVVEETFGIRLLEWNPEKGLTINGKREILRGACVHHDNGVLGACTYPEAEERRVRILKENGYNAIRSAHNPCSKALLRACDEMGMLVMDEYIDGWYIHKTKYDYADEILDNYRKDLKDMVDKDYNHPSVIMYSTGNEVSETAQKKGIALTKSLTDRLHELDSTRPVSCGINIFFNFLSSMGFGVYSDKKADEAAENAKKKKAVGSEFYNTVAGIFGAGFMKTGATLYPCDVKTRDAYANMDVAGYNYGIKRYHHDLKKYPKRIILGSETFCADAYRFMQEAKRDKRIIGDFVWATQDYLGEVGIGAWEYKDYAPRFDGGCGWVSAGSGRIDLTGKPLGEMAYTRVAFELEDLAIAVMPVDHTKDAHSPSAWKMTNAIESWSWEGCDGNAAKVEVYTRADHVKLYINGKCIGTKKPKNDCKVFFDTTYQNGEIKAVAYDANDNIIAERTLTTAGKETILVAEPELTRVNADTDLCYVRMRYTDENGQTKPLVRGRIQLTVEGGELLAFGSACPYYPESYQSNETDTYYGEALAIIRPQAGAGKVVVKAESELGNAETEIEILD